MKSFPNRINNLFIQLDWHIGLYYFPPTPPFPPVPGATLHIAGGQLSWARIAGLNMENSHRVLADGLEMLSRGHEVNMLVIPHMSLPPLPVDILTPLHIICSSSKCQAAVTNVLLPQGPAAVSILWGYLGINVACNHPVSQPTCLVFNSGTVEFEFTWADLLAAVLLYALDVAVQLILHAFAGPPPNGLGAMVFWEILRTEPRLFVRDFLDNSGIGEIGSAFVDAFANWITGNSETLPGADLGGDDWLQNAVRALAREYARRRSININDIYSASFEDSLLTSLGNTSNELHLHGDLLDQLMNSQEARDLDNAIIGIMDGSPTGPENPQLLAFGGGEGEWGWDLASIHNKIVVAGGNELTWVLRRADVMWIVTELPNGDIQIHHTIKDVFDLEPHSEGDPNTSSLYNRVTGFLGLIYHDKFGGSRELTHYAEWTTTYSSDGTRVRSATGSSTGP